MIAIQEHNVDIVSTLLLAGVNPCKNPLYLQAAIQEGEKEIVRLLISFGADPSLKNKSGKNAFDLLRLPEQNDIMELMKDTKVIEKSDENKPKATLIKKEVTSLSALLDALPPAPKQKPSPSYTVTKL